MQNKVTSYATSKRLHELGFDEATDKVWLIYTPSLMKDKVGPELIQLYTGLSDYQIKDDVLEEAFPEHTHDIDFHKITEQFKAYDCHDLLMWLKDNSVTEPSLHFIRYTTEDKNIWDVSLGYENYLDVENEQPQEALDVYTRALKFKTRKEQAFFILGESNFKKRDPKFSGIVFKMLDDKNPTELIWNLLYPEAGSTFKGAKNESNNT